MTGWRESREEWETHGQLHEQESWREREQTACLGGTWHAYFMYKRQAFHFHI